MQSEQATVDNHSNDPETLDVSNHSNGILVLHMGIDRSCSCNMPQATRSSRVARDTTQAQDLVIA